MPTNQYHLLHFIPATESWEMPPVLEALAMQLVRSGKLRINADTERNFVRHGTSDTDQTFTARELTDPALAPHTRRLLAKHVAPAAGADGVELLWQRLLGELKKARGVSAAKEMKVARVLVQSAHPSVIRLLLMSGTEIFVSYSHNVGDLMAVRHWATHGTNSGMQSTEERGTAVYVSAGGDPFFEGEHKTYTTDGFPALARMVIIAGQELGHFADLMRGRDGAIIGRHSVDPHHQKLRANPVAAEARLADLRHLTQLAHACAQAGLSGLVKAEQGVAFYHTRYRFTPPWLLYQLLRFFAWARFVLACKGRGVYLPLKVFPYKRLGDATATFLSDMQFNLAPEADVYRDPDPLAEEAIAVIEAVARVPQQEHKWGGEAIAFGWPNLNPFYNGTIIPAAAALSPMPEVKTTIIQKFKSIIRRQLLPKPGYYPS